MNTKGSIFAFLAAFCNAWVGVITLYVFSYGVSPDGVAFYKCVAAFICLSVLLLLRKKTRQAILKLTSFLPHIALLALFGIFILYFFETAAYRHAHVAIAVFTLLGVSTITTFIASYLFLDMRLNYKHWLAVLFALLGLLWFYLGEHDQFYLTSGLLLAAIAGVGYGLFLVVNKKINMPFSGFAMLWWMLGIGSVYLAIPYLFTHPSLPPIQSWFGIVMLGLVPTIGGFYFTTKALSLTSSIQVQLFELAEPILASILAIIFFHQWLNGFDIAGAIFILIAICLVTRKTTLGPDTRLS